MYVFVLHLDGVERPEIKADVTHILDANQPLRVCVGSALVYGRSA
jgi:hypothetical protein